MRVYVVYMSEWLDSGIFGIFSSLEKAREAAGITPYNPFAIQTSGTTLAAGS